MKKLISAAFGMAILWVAMSFCVYKTEKGKLQIDISHTVGTLPLKLDSVTYKNALGQDFIITNFKYYISNIVLKSANGKEYRSGASFLVTEDDEASKHLILEGIPDGTYTALDFIIGVDSLHNCSGAQSGALDASNGMYWSWNSGYIFLKLEGKSPASVSPGHIFEYHIGGYKHPDNCIRDIHLPLAAPILLHENKTGHIALKADAAEILKTPQTIDFSILSSVVDFHHATMVADNYKDMFSTIPAPDEK